MCKCFRCSAKVDDNSYCRSCDMYTPDSSKLEFFHMDSPQAEHQWPFVYLHGQAEVLCEQYAGDAAPDLCGANQPYEIYTPAFPEKDDQIALPCIVYDNAAVVVLRHDGRIWRGRITLIHDIPACKYCYTPEKWSC